MPSTRACLLLPPLLLLAATAGLRGQERQFAALGKLGLPNVPTHTRALALVDVDGDAALDLIVATGPQQPVLLFRGDGRGRFVQSSGFQSPIEHTTSMGTGDVDGDGDVDAVTGGWEVTARLYTNDGNGGFRDAGSKLPPTPKAVNSVELGDIDGDGDLDLVLGIAYVSTTPPSGSRLYVNDGMGNFTDRSEAQLPADTNSSTMRLGDVDGDGDLDIVAGVWEGQSRLYLNDGKGRFADVTTTHMPVARNRIIPVALGDLDADGDLDVVFGSSWQQNRLYLNDGKGVFTDGTSGRLPPDQDRCIDLRLADFDLDGDLDVVIAPYAQLKLYLNDGKARFTDVTASRLPVITDEPGFLAVGDVDDDGDADLVTGTWALVAPVLDRLYVNLHHHVYAASEARSGRDYTLAHYVSPGYATAFALGVTMIALEAQKQPVPPYGTLGLDLRQAIVLPLHVVSPSLGRAEIFVPIPGSGLLGRTLYSQALTIRDLMLPPATWRLGNVMADRIQ